MAISLLQNLWVKFLFIFIISYFVLVGLFNFKPLVTIVNNSYHSISQKVLQIALPDAEITTTIGKQKGVKDVNVMSVNFTWTKSLVDQLIIRAKKEKIANISVPHRYVDYYLYQFFTVPFIFLLSLLLATPLKVVDKIISIVVGFAILGTYLWTKLFLFVIFSISNVKIGIYELSHEKMLILQKLANVLTLGVSVILIVVIWAVTSFRKSTLQNEIVAMFNALQNKS